MTRSLFAPAAVAALLSAGCVPVTEPVGAVEKAEPDKKLVGKWTVARGKGLAGMLNVSALEIDVPVVKGNPKGLMRNAENDKAPLWFFTAAVGKHTYANVVLSANGGESPKFDKEGTFAEWKKGENKQFFVFKYALDGDALVLDAGNLDTFKVLAKDNMFDDDGGKHIPFFKTPAGWLAKHLDKSGPAKIFDGTNVLELMRDKK